MGWTNHSRLRAAPTARTWLGVWLLLHLLAFAITPFLHLALQAVPGSHHACCASPAGENGDLQAAQPAGHNHANCSICQQIAHGQQLHAGEPIPLEISTGGLAARLAAASLILPTRPELHAHGARAPPVAC